MSTNKKKLKRLVDSESTVSYEEDFKSKFLLDSEEQSLRAFVKKHENSPLFKGAFSRCLSIGIVSVNDYERKSNFYTSCILHFIGFQISSFVTLNILRQNRIINSEFKTWKFFIVTVLFSSSVCGYQYFKLFNELDKKYTPVWLKSKGSLTAVNI